MLDSAKSEVRADLTALRAGDLLPGGGVWMPVEMAEAMLDRVFQETRYDAGYGTRSELYRALIRVASESTP